jgi:hypothetical protein
LGPALNGICRFVVEEFLEKMFLLENQFAGKNHKKPLKNQHHLLESVA